MCSAHEARLALEGVGMIEGLAADEVDARLGRYNRLSDIGRRGLAFYLLDVQERRLYQKWAHSDTVAYAQHRHDISPRRTRELIGVAKKLRDLPAIDGAFCEQEISWTKVLLLTRVASPQHEVAWLETARKLGSQDLGRKVMLAKEGGPPRDPGDALGLSKVRFPVQAKLAAVPYRLFDQAQRKLSEEIGKHATVAELLEVMSGIYLDMERTGEAPGWNHVPASHYRIVLRPDVPVEEQTPLYVETEDGLFPVNGSDDEDVMARQRMACACCDGQVHVDGQEDKAPPTPTAMRRSVLARDGHRCRCCGGRRQLQVHHIVWRSEGGRTKVWNLITLCMRCHALVHEGLLLLEGRTQKKVRFLDSDGQPLHEPGDTVDPGDLLKIQAPPPRPVVAARPAPSAEVTTIDDIPDVVDGKWWRRHADLIRARADGTLVYRPGTPTPEQDMPAEAQALRPNSCAFEGLVGQDALLERFDIEAEASRTLGKPFPHTLLTGPPGTGKTTLAQRLALRTGASLHRANGPAVKSADALLRLLVGLQEHDLLFIDEVHAMPQGVVEILYEAMAEQRLSLTIQQGARARCVQIDLPGFTVLGATTDPADLPDAFLSRFGLLEHLDPYETSDLAAMVTAATDDEGFEVADEAATRLAETARGAPREALRLSQRAIRYAVSRGRRTIDLSFVEWFLERMGLDENSLWPVERRCLALLRASPDPIPLSRLARLLHVDVGTLQHRIEPFLLNRGLMRVTIRGRIASPWLRGESTTPAPHFKPSPERRETAVSQAAGSNASES